MFQEPGQERQQRTVTKQGSLAEAEAESSPGSEASPLEAAADTPDSASLADLVPDFQRVKISGEDSTVSCDWSGPGSRDRRAHL